jgi:hypothetical protein
MTCMRTILLLVVLPSCIAAAQDTTALSGCYRFDRAYFKWVGRAPGKSAVVRDSTRDLRLFGRSGMTHWLVNGPALDVQPIPFVADSFTTLRWLGPSHWSISAPYTVNIVWRNGLYGPVFRLAVAGDTLRGQVRFTTDVDGAEPPPEQAWAVRVACPGS